MALRTIKYDDRKSIVTAWSAELGRISLLIPAGSSREAQRRRALMMPLSLFEGEADIRPGRELLSIRDVRPLRVLTQLSCEPTKAVIAMFLSEVLERVLREAPSDKSLTAYLFDAIDRLDSMERAVGIANYPLVFLYRLCYFIGIQPDISAWRPTRYFDMRGGEFRASMPIHGNYLDPEGAATVAILGRLDFETSQRLRIPRAMRREMLSTLLRYYTLHHTNLENLNSLSVVTEIF